MVYLLKKISRALSKINPAFFTRYILGSLVLVVIVLFAAVAQAPSPSLLVAVLNVGQGDAIYIRTPTGQDALFDGGPNDDVTRELAGVMPFWDRQLDLVVASHNHKDHIAGLVDVIERFQVDEIWISGAIHTSQTFADFLSSVKAEQATGAKVQNPKVGQTKWLGDLSIRILFPLDDLIGQNPPDQHDATLVARLDYGRVCLLLTGDLNQSHEQQILKNRGQDVQDCQILKLPHHGSKTALIDQFLVKVNPKLAIISVGQNNSFGHPAPSILSKLADRGIELYRTDQNGRVEIFSNSQTYWVKTER